ncbi:SusC/RagA family TonB-linked outer membrane protein [Pontibacter indicus]|uniref:TonB-linked outer membrane protein, SusC/RagA family n=1 Tax=Pontibacter indicus TaxID=1317125 RepID=A0A1R3XHG4_9BACT|nr:TonB-dependent receptor [Pontibacter indicus]SIT90897.1 TonB-linked outer membrane protein, SusC/RagA family [Pontibacter indicus]
MKKVLLLNFLFLFALLGQVAAQSRTITGKVTGAGDGAPLPGVSVVVKGTTTGTATNADGSFSVNVPANATTLVFRYIGYVAQEVAIGANTSINVALELDSKQLSEVVIQVPYGTVAKTAFTGAESTITTKSIERQQVTSVTKVLEGLVAGVQTTNGGGGPGSNADIRVRGIGSINASSSPLYVVDGIPYDGTLQSISTDDIATVTVLKDAAASALYGSRAANGVVMITTKRGSKSRAGVSVNLRRGISERAIKEYERVTPQQYYELSWEAMRNNRLAAGLSPEAANKFASDNIGTSNGLVYNPFNVGRTEIIDPATGKLNPNAALLYQDSWSDVLFQQANRTDLNVNVSGAGDKSDYYLSVGYIDEEGIAKFSGYDRVNARASINTQVNDWLKTGINLTGNLSENQGNYATGTATSNPFYYSRNMGPIYPVWQRDGEGRFIQDPIRGGNALDWGGGTNAPMGIRPYAPNSNLLGTLALDERSMRRSEATANTYAEIKFLKDFTFKTTFGGNYYNGFATTYQNSQFGDAAADKGRSTKADTRTLSYTFNQVLTWNKKFGEHSITALAGHENYSWESRNVSSTKTGFPFPGTTELASAANITGGTSTFNEHRIEGYFSQVSYSLKDKYLASASFRRDGTSRFFEDARWGNFYSIGAGWRISEEDFLSADWIDELKLRGSYGEQGNEMTTSVYQWQGLYGLGYNNALNPGAIAENLVAKDLQWETNANFNIGADFRFFNKVDGTVEYFQRTSDNLLFQVQLPYSSAGDLRQWANIGTMTNKGWEIQLGYNAISTSDFDWRIDFNATTFKNEITKLPNGDPIVSGTKRLAEGKDIYAFWAREYMGVDPKNGDALYRADPKLYNPSSTAYQIIGSDTVTNNINNGVFGYHGTAIPDFTGGLSNSFRYKAFDLAVLATFQIGGTFYDSNYLTLMHRGAYGTHMHKDLLNRWTPENPNTDVPRLQNAITNQDGYSSRWLFDASYLNIKNINFGYTLPASLISKVGVSNVRAFASVENALILTKNPGMDPQRTFNGTADFTYPVMRTYTIGLNANF